PEEWQVEMEVEPRECGSGESRPGSLPAVWDVGIPLCPGNGRRGRLCQPGYRRLTLDLSVWSRHLSGFHARVDGETGRYPAKHPAVFRRRFCEPISASWLLPDS